MKEHSDVTEMGRVAVRHIMDVTTWFIPNSTFDRAKEIFGSGLMRDVTFNPRATVMKDVICHTSRISEAEATGLLEINLRPEDPVMPRKARTTCELTYDPKQKAFTDKHNPSRVITRADFLVLRYDGSAQAGWIR